MQPEKMGPWRIEKKIGAGGMGSVYLGVHSETGQQAAIKVLPPSLAREDGFVARFNREVESMRTLNNPYIVAFYDAGVDNETYYYAMEYVEGDTLTNLLRREKRLSWEQTIEYAIQICTALKAAHDAGIVHRDLKPSNLLITPDGVIKLTDFGVAQVFAAGKLTVTGGIIGTAEYMSPEQAQGQRASKKSDLYSLGAVMYAMVTGRPPFSGKTTLEVIQKHKFGQFDRPNMYVPEIPLWVNDVICQLLEKEPDKRFPDAYVLSRRMQEMLQRHRQKQADATLGDAGSSLDETIATNDGEVDPNDPKATLMRDLVRAQIEAAQDKGPLGNLLDNTLVLVVLLALLVWGGWTLLGNREPTPEERFTAGEAIMQQPADSQWLRARREYFEPLLELDEARWGEKVQGYLDQIAAYEATRPQRLSRNAPVSDASEPQRLLRLSDHYRTLGDDARARSVLVALRALLPPNGDAVVRAQVEQRLQVLDDPPEVESAFGPFLEAALRRAEAARREDRLEDAREICRALIAAYRTDPRAAEFTARAQTLLESLDSP